MPDYELLAFECPPGPNCPAVRRDCAAGAVVIVGAAITDPEALAALGVSPGEAAVEVTEDLYRAGHAALEQERSS